VKGTTFSIHATALQGPRRYARGSHHPGQNYLDARTRSVPLPIVWAKAASTA